MKIYENILLTIAASALAPFFINLFSSYFYDLLKKRVSGFNLIQMFFQQTAHNHFVSAHHYTPPPRQPPRESRHRNKPNFFRRMMYEIVSKVFSDGRKKWLLNICKDCGKTWYPRNRPVSQQCSRCHGCNVKIDWAAAIIRRIF